MANSKMGYLPNDAPEMGQRILLGFQHVLTMFPATVFVALFTGFHVSTVLFASGVSTIVALTLSKWQIGKFIPLFYGSSFSYMAAYIAITGTVFQIAPDEKISIMQTGIVVTGLLNIVVGFVIKKVGKGAVDKVLPVVVTGSVATVIGFALGKAAIDMSTGIALGFEQADPTFLFVAFVTLMATILFSVYLQHKGFIGMLPILLGAIVGYVVAMAFGLVDISGIGAAAVFEVPHFTLPATSGELLGVAVFSIAIMAIATIPESTAHLYQISLYVDRLAEDMGEEAYELDQHIGFNLILDGIGDFINGMMGATAGTNYGENNSLMAITRNYSGPALIMAGIISIILAFSGTLSAIITSVPIAVSGGLALYLFGVIGMQGIALMVENNLDLFDPKNLAIGAVIMVVGIGGHIGFENGLIPIPLLTSVFPSGWPAIATGAVFGILLNAVFLIFKPSEG